MTSPDDAALRCRICGYRYDEPVWGVDGRSPEHDLCICCGVEIGYQDATPTGAARFRERWLAQGAPWHHSERRPPDWNLEDQLGHVPEEFR